MWKDFFYYTRNEQRGIVVLFFLIIIVIFLRVTITYWMPKSNNTLEQEKFISTVKALNDSLVRLNKGCAKDILFSFNPNTVTTQELELLGFSNYQKKSFLGYRNKVKAFSSKKDLYRVYGMDSSFVDKLSDYIIWESSEVQDNKRVLAKESHVDWVNFNEIDSGFLQSHISSLSLRDSIFTHISKTYITKSLPLKSVESFTDHRLYEWLKSNSIPKGHERKTNKEIVVVEINSADTMDFKKLVGIGSVYAQRIVKFRNLLGGFYSIKQIKEVYGLPDNVFHQIEKKLRVNVELIKKIDPEKSTISDIARHPYFTYEQSIELVNLYRKNANPVRDNILDLESIDEVEFERMKNYLIYKLN